MSGVRRAQLDRHDIIEPEANSSATASLALFSGCDISKSSIAGSALCRSYGRQTERFGLYIHPRKPFAINANLYIQNRNPFVISKWRCIPQGAVLCPLQPLAHRFSICIYVPGSPLPSTNICIYRTASHLLSANPWYTYRERCTQYQTARNSQSKPDPDEAAATGSKPRSSVSRYHLYHRGENIYPAHFEKWRSRPSRKRVAAPPRQTRSRWKITL